MSDYWSDTYEEIANLLTDTFMFEGGATSDLVKFTINRAAQQLWQLRYWDYLLTTSSLSLDSNNQVSLPSDFGRVYQVYADPDSDGRPDYYFFRNSRDRQYRYTVESTFDKSTGQAWTMTFAKAPQYSPILKYQKVLEKFTGSGTEYSYFPAQLVILRAKLNHAVDNGLTGGPEYQETRNEYNEFLKEYMAAHQYQNNEMVLEQNDINGREVVNEEYNLDGAIYAERGVYDNDVDLG